MYIVGRQMWPAINAFLLLLGSLVSHFVAGGHFVGMTNLIELAAALYLALFMVRKNFTPGPQLAMIVIFAQSFGHIILGQTSHSNLTMLVSHVIGGLLSYKVVAHSERFWNRLADFILTPLAIIFATRIRVPGFTTVRVVDNQRLAHETFIHLLKFKRGPPQQLRLALTFCSEGL